MALVIEGKRREENEKENSFSFDGEKKRKNKAIEK